jgi:hypothetical protein
MENSMKQILKAAVASALAAGGLSLALAQAPTPRPGDAGLQRPGMQQGMHEGMRGPRGAMNPADRAEARLSYIRTALKITPAQEPQWNAYAGFVRKSSADMQQRFEQRRQARQQQGAQPGVAQAGAQGGPRAGQRFERPNAVQSIERQQAMHAEASRRLGELLAVQKPLYDVLSPEQRKVADEVLSPRRFASREGRGGMRRG